MKVSELNAILQTMPPDALVLIPLESGYESPRETYLTQAAEHADKRPEAGIGSYVVKDSAFETYETVGELFEVVVIDTSKGACQC
ncbi:MAG: hypothetical protein Q8K61_10555 [Gallionella sp.]|nr:hypothetical protein [Gallionella sp.]